MLWLFLRKASFRCCVVTAGIVTASHWHPMHLDSFPQTNMWRRRWTGATNTNDMPSGPNSFNFIADAAEKVLDSVVNITMETEVNTWLSRRTICSRGSGFFISEDGKILTNAHVVHGFTNGSKIVITTADGREYEGSIHAVDGLADLAIISIIPDYTEQDPIWKPVKLGSSADSRPGDWVVAVGNPFGFQHTITAGIISSQRRKGVEIGRIDSRVEYLQTDCVIHSGSSGGPLVNLEGEVIGINTVKADSEGISFAIKVNHSMDMINQLVELRRVVRPWLGVGVVSLSPYVWQQLRAEAPLELIPETNAGVFITSVEPDSPAAKAGCLVGDVIIEVDNAPVDSASKFLKIIGLRVDKPVSIALRRNTPSKDPQITKSIVLHISIQPEELPHK